MTRTHSVASVVSRTVATRKDPLTACIDYPTGH